MGARGTEDRGCVRVPSRNKRVSAFRLVRQRFRDHLIHWLIA